MPLFGSRDSLSLHPRPSTTGHKSRLPSRQGSFLDTVDSFKLEPIKGRRSSVASSIGSFTHLDNDNNTETSSRRPSHLIIPGRFSSSSSRSKRTPNQSITSFEPSSITEYKQLRYMTNRDFQRRQSSITRQGLGTKTGFYDKHCLFVSITGITIKLKLGQRRPVEPGSSSRLAWSAFSSRDRPQRHAPSPSFFSFQFSEAALSGGHRRRSMTLDIASFLSTEKIKDTTLDVPFSERRRSLELQAKTLDAQFSSSVESLTQAGPRLSFVWREMGLSLQPLSATSTSLYEVLMSGQKKTSQDKKKIKTSKTKPLGKKKSSKSFTSDNLMQRDAPDLERPKIKRSKSKTPASDMRSEHKHFLQIPRSQKKQLFQDNEDMEKEENKMSSVELSQYMGSLSPSLVPLSPISESVTQKQGSVLPTSENVQVLVGPKHMKPAKDTADNVYSPETVIIKKNDIPKTHLADSDDERQSWKKSKDKTPSFIDDQTIMAPEFSDHTGLPATLPEKDMPFKKKLSEKSELGAALSEEKLHDSDTAVAGKENMRENVPSDYMSDTLPRIPSQYVPPFASRTPSQMEQKTESGEQLAEINQISLENLPRISPKIAPKTPLDEPTIESKTKTLLDHKTLLKPETPKGYKPVPPSVTPDYKSIPPSKIPSDYKSVAPSKTPSDYKSVIPSKIPSDDKSLVPTKIISDNTSIAPSKTPLDYKSVLPSKTPSEYKSTNISKSPSDYKSVPPSRIPSDYKSVPPSRIPSDYKSVPPSRIPSDYKSVPPSRIPSDYKSLRPSKTPSFDIGTESSTLSAESSDLSKELAISSVRPLEPDSKTPSDYKSVLHSRTSSPQSSRFFVDDILTPGEPETFYTTPREEMNIDWEAGFYDCISLEETKPPPSTTINRRRRFASRLAATLRQALGWFFSGIVRRRAEEHDDQDFKSIEESSNGDSGRSYFSPKEMSIEA